MLLRICGVSSGEYIAQDDETPRSIGQKLGVSPDLLVSLNKATYSGLHLNAKLHKGTLLQIPPRHQQEALATSAAGPLENNNVQIHVESLISAAARALLASFDARLRSQIVSGSSMSSSSKARSAPQTGETVIRLRKAQRFLHGKQDRRMASVCKILEDMVKDPDAWPLVDGIDEAEHPQMRSCTHTMNLRCVQSSSIDFPPCALCGL